MTRSPWMKSLALSAALLGSVWSTAQTTPAPTTATTPITIGGTLDAPRNYTLADLKALPSREITLSYTGGTSANMQATTHRYRGVLLYDVLNSARPGFDSAVKNDRLRWYVLATGADGYSAVFAWGELVPDFGNRAVLLAYEQDGQPLPAADGAVRLVVPGDGKGGRFVGNLISVQVFRADH